MKRRLFIIAALFACLSSSAQLSEMLVESIQDIGANTAPEYDRTRNAMAKIEVVTNEAMNGLAIVDNSYVMPSETNTDTDTHFYGKAAASNLLHAQYLTLYHPSFSPLNIELENYDNVYPLKGDRAYRVSVSVPSAKMVEANLAFNNLEYDKAATLYHAITAPDNERSIAQIRLNSIPELKAKLAEAEKFAATGTDVGLFRAMHYYRDISTLTKSTVAKQRMMAIQNKLLPNKTVFDGHPIGISNLTLEEVKETNGVEAKTEKSIERLDPSRPYYALIIVSTPLDSVTFECDTTFHRAFTKNGEYFVLMKPGENGAQKDFVVKHRDCKDLSIKLKDYGISTLKSGVTYRMSVATPSFDMMEADRYFSVMEFDKARPIYARIDSLPADYPSADVALAKTRIKQCQVFNTYLDTWQSLRDEVNAGGNLVDRAEMCSKIDTIIVLSNRFVDGGIPSAKWAAESAKKLRVNYEKCYHLTLLVTGQKGPIKSDKLYVEFKHDKLKQVEVARKLPGKKNEYRLFLPEELSGYVARGGEVEMRVATEVNDKFEIDGTKSTKQSISKDGDNLNITFNVII